MSEIVKIGRYEIQRELGKGGMAVVYAARDPYMNRTVAIKLLADKLDENSELLARFKREAEVVAALEHPAIVPIHDFGQHGGKPFIVMRYMSGGSLANKLTTGPLSLLDAARLFARLAPALDEAHGRGIVHRDLKPANILFDHRGDPYLADFGIAKLSEGKSTQLTSVGLTLGTPAYMSPEQAQGLPDIDGRSDIYALGVILFETLTGARPYQASTPMALALKHVMDPIPEVRGIRDDLPAGVQPVINKAIAKSPADRYPSATELARAIIALQSGTHPVLAAERPVDDPVSGIGSAIGPVRPVPQPAPSTAVPEEKGGHTQVVAPPSAPRLAEAVAAAESAAQPAAAAPPKKRRPAWFLLGVAFFGLVVVPGLAIALFSFGALLGDDPTPTATQVIAAVDTPPPATATTAPTQPPAASATPPPTFTLAPIVTRAAAETATPSATPVPLPTPERGANLLANESFEQNPEQNAPFWIISTRRTDLVTVWSDAQARTGSYALRLTASEPGQFGPPGWNTTVPHAPGHGYSFEVWYRSPDGATPVIAIEMLDADGRVLGTVSEAARVPTINWQVLRTTIAANDVEPETVTLRIGLLQFLRAGEGRKTLFFDDVALIVDY